MYLIVPHQHSSTIQQTPHKLPLTCKNIEPHMKTLTTPLTLRSLLPLFIMGSLLTFSQTASANAGLGVQIFGESNHDHVEISGANLIVGSQSYGWNQQSGDHSFLYAGVGFKNIEGYSPSIDGIYPQVIFGLAMPWIISPYVEVGFDPFDYLVEEFDERDDGINSYLGVGARLSLNRRLSLDVGYKYHHFSDDSDNFYSYSEQHHNNHKDYYEDEGIGTASVSLNFSF
jgi:hypothetical protein